MKERGGFMKGVRRKYRDTRVIQVELGGFAGDVMCRQLEVQ